MKLKLTESEFNNFIYETVKHAINEIGDTVYGQNMLGRVCGRANANKNHANNRKDFEKYSQIEKDSQDAKLRGMKDIRAKGERDFYNKEFSYGYNKGYNKAVKNNHKNNKK